MILNTEELVRISLSKGLSMDELIALLLIYNASPQYKEYLISLGWNITIVYTLMEKGYVIQTTIPLKDAELSCNIKKVKELFNTEEDIIDWRVEIKSPTDNIKEFKQWCETWNQKWKGIKSNYGLVKGDSRSVIDKMSKFIKTFKHSQQTILDATDYYLNQQKTNNNYYYCMDSGNFISHRDKGSTLNKYCEMIKDGAVLVEEDWTKNAV